MRLKSNVSLRDLQPATIVGMLVARDVYASIGLDVTITSVNDSTHSVASLHFKGRAFDLRTHNLQPGQAVVVRNKLIEALGDEWDVVLENLGEANEHIHVEYDPKRVAGQ